MKLNRFKWVLFQDMYLYPSTLLYEFASIILILLMYSGGGIRWHMPIVLLLIVSLSWFHCPPFPDFLWSIDGNSAKLREMLLTEKLPQNQPKL